MFTSCSKDNVEMADEDDIDAVDKDDNEENGEESSATYSFIGNDFQVNSYKEDNQNYPKVAIAPDGKAIVVWESAGQDGDGHAVVAQRYNSDGSKWGNEFVVNTETKLAQSQPTVAVADDGSHIILWRSKDQDGSGFGVYAQRYDSSGNEVSDEFRINEETNSNQDLAYAAYHSNGNLMIIWESSDQDGKAGEIYARVYDDEFNDISNGEFRVNTVIDGWQNTARIADTPSGFIVVWESLNIDSERIAIVFKRFSSEGTALMTMEEQVNTREICDQKNPDIATLADGKFVIVWEHLEDPDKCSSAKTLASDIAARIYNSDGTALTGEIILSQNTSGNQNLGIANDNQGGVAVIWQGDASSNDSTDEIYGRRLLATGTLIGDVFIVNSNSDSYQVFPAIAAAPDGNLFAVWGSWSGDGNGTSIRARRLKVGE
ncbi:hypothetical protein [Flavivirga rizhaonensis]|uniref:hypothetical protein n=1 Tax=Flavivirga rizhaonensis TaxID=2559571 RepID=UPI001B875168|nr:hypothetical protein [Flavivirga rizhaonensis]